MKNRKEQKEENISPKTTSKSSFTKFCAFWGITLAATLFLVNGILKLLTNLGVESDGLNSCMSAFDFIAKLALLVAVGIPAYGYVRNKKLGWKIVFIIAIVFYAGFCVYHLF